MTDPTTRLNDQTERLQQAPATDDGYDLHAALDDLLSTVGLAASDSGGAIDFVGADPVLPGTLRLAGATSLALVAKSVAVAAIWRMRGGRAQDIAMDLRVAPHRLCPFYDRRWELLNGYPMVDTVRVSDAFATDRFYRTADDRWVHPMGPYPRLRNDTAALLDVPEVESRVAEAISKWKAEDLETAGEEAGIIMPMCRTVGEIIASDQYQQVLGPMNPVVIEKVGDSDPEPLPEGGTMPLSGVRALGRAHIIAGAGCGRALALHGADVLNVWDPYEWEMPLLYGTSNVGMRSTTLDLKTGAGSETMLGLLRGADVFFANRRPGYLRRRGLDVDSAVAQRPGLIHATVNLNGETGLWAGRVGFDQTAGALAGVMLSEGENGVPALPALPVVNDYITSWLLELGVLRALMLRAEQGGSYKVTVSLTRTALWLLSLGTFDKAYAAGVAGSAPGHEYLDPQTFTADTSLGRYQGIAEQVRMSQTPGYYTNPLVPRGAGLPIWRQG
ncbi:CoA transferase [Tsukamurella sp. 8F]|uniref:CoA transferase n=1 Tax=unclassified Tsukamurella TaxID=2633480 RepID=UPI0023B8B42D|nr:MULTISPECIES: CoA transferase [unclassified Tsukamurella]MDF0530367.1 CoA transferase [Tsukamurella sp. 8J]MDF0587664.1 CoA transferase [Tsukamurella sp. 8F]